MRQRRWAERGRFDPVVGPHQQTKRDTERLYQRLLLIGAAVVGVILLGLVGFALYTGVYAPPRRVVAKVGDETIRLRDVPPYLLLNTTTQSAPSPTNAFTFLVRDKVILQRAASLGITTSSVEIDEAIIRRFEQSPENPDDPLPEALTADGERRYADFIKAVGIDKGQYRQWVEAQLLLEALRQHFIDDQPEEIEQVFARWIIAENSEKAQTAKERLAAGEAFADVAKDLHVSIGVEEGEAGQLGWVPRGVFPELEEAFFESEVGKVSDPISSSVGSIIVLVEQGPQMQTLTDPMKSLRASNQFQNWMDQQVDEIVTQFTFSTEDNNWVLERLIS